MRIVIVHGFSGKANNGWRKWLGEKLEKKGYQVFQPQMPNPRFPKLEKWLETLSLTIGKPGNDLILIGHSLGCITILRYLERTNQKIKAVILVAGFSSNSGLPIIDAFTKKQLNWAKIKKSCSKFICFNSTNDPFVRLSEGNNFNKKLNAKLIIMKEKGHLSSRDLQIFPELLKQINKLI